MGRKKRIAIIHPKILLGGGSEAPALWTVEALKKDYDVYLVTMGKVYIERLNECYGTNLKPDQVKTIEIPIPSIFKNRFDALRNYRLARFGKQKVFEFDLLISTYNVMNFKQRGIQYISDFSFDDKLRRSFDKTPPGLKGLLYRKSPFRWMYLQIGKVLSGLYRDDWKRNVTIANSDWSGKVMKESYGIETQTIYPPVVGEYPEIPRERKKNGFVFIGRMVPEKRIDRIIRILKRVRERGLDVHLHILGRADDSEYTRKVIRLCDENSDWAFIEGEIFGDKKEELLTQHKFGISGRENEPFGIAVAEMVKGGCISWVPDGGGQVEIVNHPHLIYQDEEDAAEKIEKVINNRDLQNILLHHLKKQAEIFSSANFMSEIKILVEDFFKEKEKSCA